jgi:hypothetical protein
VHGFDAAFSDLWVEYVGAGGTSVEEPVRELEGFQCVALAPGETKEVSLALSAEDFAVWNIGHERTVEPSAVRIWVGPDSAHGKAAALGDQGVGFMIGRRYGGVEVRGDNRWENKIGKA